MKYRYGLRSKQTDYNEPWLSGADVGGKRHSAFFGRFQKGLVKTNGIGFRRKFVEIDVFRPEWNSGRHLERVVEATTYQGIFWK